MTTHSLSSENVGQLHSLVKRFGPMTSRQLSEITRWPIARINKMLVRNPDMFRRCGKRGNAVLWVNSD